LIIFDQENKFILMLLKKTTNPSDVTPKLISLPASSCVKIKH
jgi:hypothetical protein